MSDLLDNVFWHALTGAHAHLSAGTGGARRYAEGYTPLLAFADPEAPDFAALMPHCRPDERFYCADWSGTAPSGWRIELEATMQRMVWHGPLPDDDGWSEPVPLTAGHAAAAVELAALTRPGPFGPRTIAMGEYFGVFDGTRLIAMAGERTHAGRYREVSGVCTHPDHQGRGLARRLMLKVIRREMERGETPILHVMSSNTTALGLYERMGFRSWCETPVRVVART